MSLTLSFRQVALAVAALIILGLELRASAAPPVAFRGHADLVITGAEDLSPTSRRLTTYATGQATYMARFTRTETVIVDLSNGTFTATLVFTADKGDQLYANAAGHFTSPNGDSAEGTYVFTGGTGRFQNASGEAAFTVKPDGTSFDVKFNGTIQYQGSDR